MSPSEPSLRSIHQYLYSYFSKLRTEKGGKAVFALEHGLDHDQLQALNEAIKIHIQSAPPSNLHWLPWVVYASEIGYEYSGDEYWHTFETKTPKWTTHGSRQWIREKFNNFADTFNGAKPTGAWAHHFTIICWPITHAILPQDLQLQLARILYELRTYLKPYHLESRAELGRRIAAASSNSTRRFQNFAQEHELIGLIGAALLLNETKDGTLLHPATLQRIVTDLEKTEHGRRWLHEARGV